MPNKASYESALGKPLTDEQYAKIQARAGGAAAPSVNPNGDPPPYWLSDTGDAIGHGALSEGWGTPGTQYYAVPASGPGALVQSGAVPPAAAAMGQAKSGAPRAHAPVAGTPSRPDVVAYGDVNAPDPTDARSAPKEVQTGMVAYPAPGFKGKLIVGPKAYPRAAQPNHQAAVDQTQSEYAATPPAPGLAAGHANFGHAPAYTAGDTYPMPKRPNTVGEFIPKHRGAFAMEDGRTTTTFGDELPATYPMPKRPHVAAGMENTPGPSNAEMAEESFREHLARLHDKFQPKPQPSADAGGDLTPEDVQYEQAALIKKYK